jgi:hypothetical protein
MFGSPVPVLLNPDPYVLNIRLVVYPGIFVQERGFIKILLKNIQIFGYKTHNILPNFGIRKVRKHSIFSLKLVDLFSKDVQTPGEVSIPPEGSLLRESTRFFFLEDYLAFPDFLSFFSPNWIWIVPLSIQ